MKTDEAFLADIRANATDDVPRLIYADWLDDHDQPERAELIRIQCRAESLPEDDEQRKKLDTQANDLLTAHLAEWVGPLKAHLMPPPFERGFPRFVVFDSAAKFVSKPVQEMVAEWFPKAGVMNVRICAPSGSANPGKFFPGVAACPAFACLHSLSLYRLQPGDKGLRLLADSPHLANLLELEITHPRCTSTGVRHLAESPQLRKLTSLTLAGVNHGPTPITESRALAPLLKGKHLPQLTTLRLWDSAWSLARGTDKNFTALPGLARLRCLDFRNNILEDKGAINLASCAQLANLTALHLANNYIRDEGMLALIDSPHLRCLERIDLRYNRKLKPATLQRLEERFGTNVQL